jgi:hypothetical protein
MRELSWPLGSPWQLAGSSRIGVETMAGKRQNFESRMFDFRFHQMEAGLVLAISRNIKSIRLIRNFCLIFENTAPEKLGFSTS